MPLRLLALSLALACSAPAQPAKESAKPEKGLSVRILAEVAPESIGKVYLQAGETQSVQFELTTSQLGAPVAVPARTLVLKTVEKNLALCPIQLPETGQSFAIVLVTAKPAGYSPLVVRTDDPAFKAGDVVFINRTEKTILGKLGDTPLVLPSGQMKKERPSSPKENAYYDIAFATRGENGDKLISSTRWPIDNQLRSYVFFFADATGKITYRAVDEYMTPPVSAKP